eukprot:scaffold25388_cov181-Cylindrotheca_fusiformis.AAC.1
MVAKSWVVSSLHINDQEATVVDENNTKLKADFDKDTKIFRLFYPGAIQFSDRDYEESKGSRLATDMGMSKVPDTVLYENESSRMEMVEEEKRVILQSSDDVYGEICASLFGIANKEGAKGKNKKGMEGSTSRNTQYGQAGTSNPCQVKMLALASFSYNLWHDCCFNKKNR